MAQLSPAVIELSIPEQQDNDGIAFPLLLGPSSNDTFKSSKEVLEWVKNNQKHIEEKLGKHGAILFRGFPMSTPDEFHDFLKGFDFEFRHQFNGGGGPRKLIVGPIQTSTESPPEFTIPFHHELAYLTSQPSKLFFFCEIPPAAKGETPICLSHRVYKKAAEKNKEFIDKITEKKIRYTRILADKATGKNLDYQRAWQDIYDTQDRKVAAERAFSSGTETVEWLDDNSMKVVSIAFPAIRVDPRHHKETWFNSAILLHPGVYGMSKDFNAWETTFADFSPIDAKDLLEVRAIMEAEGVSFKWQQGDVLLVDNFLALHSRNSFTPPRRILAAMATRRQCKSRSSENKALEWRQNFSDFYNWLYDLTLNYNSTSSTLFTYHWDIHVRQLVHLAGKTTRLCHQYNRVGNRLGLGGKSCSLILPQELRSKLVLHKMKIIVEKSDLDYLAKIGFVKNLQAANDLWTKLSERCPLLTQKEGQGSTPRINIEDELPPLKGNFGTTASYQNVSVVCSRHNGVDLARSMSDVLAKEAKTISIDLLVDQKPPDFVDLEMRVANSSALIVILSAQALRQPEVVFAMLCAKRYFATPSQVILVHDAESCLFPGYDEQPLCVQDFFSEKAITYLACYTLDGVLQIMEKWKSEMNSLENSFKNKTQAATSLYQQIIQQTNSPANQLPISEFQKALVDLEPSLTSSDVNDLAKRADPNRDNLIEEKEFCEALSLESRVAELLQKFQASQHTQSTEDLRTTVFLSTGQGIAGRLYEGLKNDYSIFLDSEAKFKIHDLKQIVLNTGVFVFILTAGIFQSQWCLEELKSAIANNKKIIVIRELSFLLPETLPEDWQDSLGALLKRGKELIWMAEYNNACIEAMKMVIGIPDKSCQKAEDFLSNILKKKDNVHKQNLLNNHTIEVEEITGMPMMIAQKVPDAVIKHATFKKCGPTSVDMKYYLNFVETLIIPDAKSFEPQRFAATLTHLQIGLSVPLDQLLLIRLCSNLKHLTLHGPNLARMHKAFFEAVSKCTSLERFELKNCETYGVDHEIIPLFRGCTNLKHLDLRGFDVLLDSTLIHLQHLTGLEALYNVNPFTGSDESTEQILQQCKLLKIVHLKLKITNKSIMKLEGCTQLQEVHLECPHLSDSAANVLKNLPLVRKLCLIEGEFQNLDFSGMKNLEEIKLSTMGQVSRVDLTATPLLKKVELCKITQLKQINLEGSNVEVLELENLQSLQRVAVPANNNLKQFGIQECKKLSHLDISGAPCLQELRLQDTYEIQNFVATGCTSLRLLRIYGSSNQSDSLIEQIAMSCPGLEHVNISRQCYYITDKGASKLALCSNLKMLTVMQTSITDVGTTEILKNCPKLEWVKFQECQYVTDLTMAAILEHGKSMQEIWFENVSITDGIVDVIFKRWEVIKQSVITSILFGNNKQLTSAAITELQEALPNIVSVMILGSLCS